MCCFVKICLCTKWHTALLRGSSDFFFFVHGVFLLSRNCFKLLSVPIMDLEPSSEHKGYQLLRGPFFSVACLMLMLFEEEYFLESRRLSKFVGVFICLRKLECREL